MKYKIKLLRRTDSHTFMDALLVIDMTFVKVMETEGTDWLTQTWIFRARSRGRQLEETIQRLNCNTTDDIIRFTVYINYTQM